MALNIIINKVSVAVSFAAGATVATAVASGGTTPYVYSLATGGDKFAINSSTGVVTTIAAMDITNIASFSVTATDSTTGTALTITSDVIYPPIQAAIQNRFNKANVIYKITNDINLNGGTLTIPAGCTLDFQGGSFSNGMLNGNNTKINGFIKIENSLLLTGSWSIKVVDVDWFIPKRDYGDSVDTYINSAFDFARKIRASITFGNNLSQGYLISNIINASGVAINGNNARLISTTSSILKFDGGCSLSNITLSFYPYQGEIGVVDNKVSAVILGDNGEPSYNSYINNVTIDGFYYGIIVNKVWNLQVSNLIIRRTRIGIQTYGLSVNNSIVNTNIDCKGTNSRCIKFGDEDSHIAEVSEGWTISNSILTSAEIAIEGNNMSHVLLSNSIVDLCSQHCCRFTRNCINIKLIGNYFACNDSGRFDIIFTGQNVLNNGDDGIIIQGNTIKSYYSSGKCGGINISSGKYESVLITDNTITSFNGGYGILLQDCNIETLDISNNRLKLCKVYFAPVETVITNLYIVNSNLNNYLKSGIKIANKKIIVDTKPPTTGTWTKNDIILNSEASIGGIIGWICESGGTPGSWFPLGTMEQYAGLKKQGTTSERPAVNQWYVGATYFDTTLGKMIVYNGSNWVNMDGTALS